MCGILFLATGVGLQTQHGLQVYPDASCPTADDFKQGLLRRGPDYQGGCQVTVGTAAFTFLGSLLQLRGAAPSRNPVQHPASGSILLFNGEVFGGLDVPTGANDGQNLLQALCQPSAAVPAVLTSLRGPWALVFWHAPTHTLWFGRDVIGRRSLLLHLPRPGDGRLLLTSSAPLDPSVPFEGFSEVPPGLYSITFSGEHQPSQQQPQHEGARLVGGYQPLAWADSWVTWLGEFARPPSLVVPAQQLEHGGPPGDAGGPGGSGCGGNAVTAGANGMLSSGDTRAAAAAVPSSTGATTNSRAAMGLQGKAASIYMDSSLNSAAAGNGGGSTVRDAVPCVPARPQQGGGSPLDPAAPLVSAAQEPCSQPRSGDPAAAAVARVLAALRHSMAVRCRCIEDQSPPDAPPLPVASPDDAGTLPLSPTPVPAPAQPAAAASPTLAATATSSPAAVPAARDPAPVLILFSGGLDSTLMAVLAHEALPPEAPIDLASICFAAGASPDRLAALDALEELHSFAPTRRWRLIQLDRSLDDVDALRPRLLRLLAPRDTVMDLNIGAALWMATEACGPVRSTGVGGDSISSSTSSSSAAGAQPAATGAEGEGEGVEPAAAVACGVEQQRRLAPGNLAQPCCYRSVARVVLLGHGADELCGGYGRHRTKFREAGWEGVAAELALDMRRLWQRNLGRDDRLVADHGREARHPFLDEGVVAAVLETPLEHVTDLRHPPGMGDKKLLRACLHQLGLPRAAGRVKRAIQFGSCLGKQANRRTFGSNRAANARSAGLLRLAEVGLD